MLNGRKLLEGTMFTCSVHTRACKFSKQTCAARQVATCEYRRCLCQLRGRAHVIARNETNRSVWQAIFSVTAAVCKLN